MPQHTKVHSFQVLIPAAETMFVAATRLGSRRRGFADPTNLVALGRAHGQKLKTSPQPVAISHQRPNLMGKGDIGNDSSMDTTSPASSSPVKVAPTPSSPISLERPENEMLSPDRKACTETRTSSG